jgi:SAM-dependent methyltransferase
MMFYDSASVHRLLVADDVRTSRFHDSIAATVSTGAVVLDVGAGSGILSLFAALAGAARVYAIERAPGAAALARRLVAANSLEGRIKVLAVPSEHAVLPEPVDVLVSEWLGVYGVDENMLPVVVAARDRWLKPNGVMIPGPVTAWAAPVEHPAGAEAVLFHSRRYGLDLSALAGFSLDEIVALPSGTAVADLRAEPLPLWVVDPATISLADASSPFRAAVTFELAGNGVNGLVVWFSATMPGAQELSNGPGRQPTHWGQFLFPLAHVSHAVAGDELQVTVECVPAGARGSHHAWSARVAGGVGEAHDSRRRPQSAAAPPWRVSYAGWERLSHREELS